MRGSFKLPSIVTMPCCKTKMALRTPYNINPTIPRSVPSRCVLTRKKPPHTTRRLAIIRSASVCPVAMCSEISAACTATRTARRIRVSIFMLLILICLNKKSYQMVKNGLVYAEKVLYHEASEIHLRSPSLVRPGFFCYEAGNKKERYDSCQLS